MKSSARLAMSEPTTERNVEQLLDRALDLPAAERERFVRQACGSDVALRERLQRLLALAEQDGGFLERSPLRSEAPTSGDASAPVASELAAGEMLGAYRVVGLIGRGGMGEVYRATRADGLFEKDVAVKVLRPDAVAHLERFESERRILARLEHPGIARLLDGGVARDGRPYMQMEFVPGTSITNYSRAQRLSLEQRLDLFRQCGEAVAFAHSQGVIHRDLKPGNIQVTAQGRVKLLDFGVAKLMRPASGAALTTTTGAPLTPAYAAPEQLQGKSISPATDIYALGVVLYELLTGHTPWQDKSHVPVSTLLYRILNDTAPPASQTAREQTDSPVPAGLLTGDLDAILARSLRKNPTERYPTVADLLADLARYQKGEPTSARTTTGETRLSRRDEAERRQLSVLFCDLVGSTELSEDLDPEAFRDVLLAYQNTATEVIDRYEGHIAQRVGDALLIYFGYPAAHDDDTERAVRCGYDLIAAVTRLDFKPPLAVRIGIHTGTVVVGQMGGNAEILATGATTNLAARLRALAEPSTVLISDATFKLVPGLFITKDLGTPDLKGLKPVRVYQVIQPSGVRSRLEAAHSLTPFVGREQEQAFLLERWNDVQEGKGQAVLFSAEPGLGKSRLLLVFRSRIAETPHTWLECRASPLTRNSAYQPVVELLHRRLAIKDGDTAEQRLLRVEQNLDAIGFDKFEIIPLLAPLLNLTLSARYPSSQLGPELKRKRTLETLSTWVLALARQQPLVIAFEDLHWTDASSLDLLGVLLEQLATVPLLLMMTARPEFTSPWPARSHFAAATLHPLRAAHAGQMVGSLSGDRPLPAAVHKTLLERAGGVPLFVEELTKSLLESGQLVERDGELELQSMIEQLSIPSTLQGSLMARLDRLGAARDLIQTAAVIGNEIPHLLLQLVADLDEPQLRQQLKRLTDAELLYMRGAPPQATYLFKHALIQDTAYDSLLKSTRQTLHGVIAVALERHFTERAQAEPEVLAEHFAKANVIEQAIKYYQLAAEHAEAKTANTEAIHYAAQAMKLLPTLSAGAARDNIELPLLLIQARGHAHLRGYSHAEVRVIVERAEALLSDAQDPAAQIKALGFLWMANNFYGQSETAIRFSERLVTLGQKLKVPIVESNGHASKGLSLNMLGRFTEAEKSFGQAVQHSDLASSKMMASQGGLDPITYALVASSFTSWVLGYPDQALAKALAAQTQAQAVGEPQNLCLAAAVGMGMVWLLRREPQLVLEACRAGIKLCERYGHSHGQTMATWFMGVALCVLGRVEEGLALIRQGIEALQATGSLMNLAMSNGFLAEQCLAHGRVSEAHAALDAAFSFVEPLNNRWWEAELYRVKGELLLAGNAADTAGAEACFDKALEVARNQQAKSFELRAATSLARLWQKPGRSHEARAVLQPVYDWFTEGFDTPDLVDAKALLRSLA